MIMITSKAGQRLAKAKAARQELKLRHSGGEDCWADLRDARHEFNRAAEAAADELIAQNFHLVEGD